MIPEKLSSLAEVSLYFLIFLALDVCEKCRHRRDSISGQSNPLRVAIILDWTLRKHSVRGLGMGSSDSVSVQFAGPCKHFNETSGNWEVGFLD